MLFMQVQCKLLPNAFSLRPDRRLEQIVLNLLRKTAPTPGNCFSKSARKFFGLFRAQLPIALISVHQTEGSQLPYQSLVLGSLAALSQKNFYT
jgi:hypothetical protein